MIAGFIKEKYNFNIDSESLEIKTGFDYDNPLLRDSVIQEMKKFVKDIQPWTGPYAPENVAASLWKMENKTDHHLIHSYPILL